MPNYVYMVVSPILLFISIPLTIFAFWTTTFAFTTLTFRALIVYAELAAVLLQNQFTRQISANTSFTPPNPVAAAKEGKYSHRKSRRGSVGSGSSNGGSMTPKAPETSGLGVYSGGGAARDFEGVGGWRIPGPDDEDMLWTGMNSRLELPVTVEGRQRNHHRSRTSGSLVTVPFPMKSPGRSRARTPTSTRGAAGSSSPEEYFANRVSSKSTTALDTANIGKALLRRKPSSSSGSSQGSSRTLNLTNSNT